MNRAIVFGILLLGGVLAAQAVMVEGHAYLSGASDHQGIKVLFRAASPSARTDSVFTGGTGAYWKILEPGVYNVDFSYEGFASYTQPTQILLFDTVLDDVTLMHALSGSLSGVLDPGDYDVTDSIWVDSTASLHIFHGVRLFFRPYKQFAVYGTLIAEGIEGDSIVFTKRYASPDSLWGGVKLYYADSSTRMDYCVIEFANRTRDYYTSAGGVVCTGTSASFSHNTFRYNRGSTDSYAYYAGGLSCFLGNNVVVINCTFFRNYGGGAGGVGLTGGNAVLRSCILDSNSADIGGGVKVQGGSPRLDSCIVRGNFASSNGAGIYCGDSTELSMTHCLISGNRVNYGGGGGVYFSSTRGATPTLSNCTIMNNRAGTGTAIYSRYSNPQILNCTIVDRPSDEWHSTSFVSLLGSQARLNGCILVSHWAGFALEFLSSPNAQITYCDILSPDTLIRYPQYAPPAIGIIALTNANGDSCDTYYNIYQDPQFVDTANGDYHLLATSPCIDAGDPALPRDPDGTIADMGAFYYPHEVNVGGDFILPPSSFTLSAYPNPFNAQTRIVFELPAAGKAQLTVFDITGRTVRTLVDGNLSAGRHEIALDGSDLSSGVYVYRLQTSGRTQSAKLVLLK